MLQKWINSAGLPLVLLGLTACSMPGTRTADGDTAIPGGVLARYERALDQMEVGDDPGAADLLESLSTEYPDYSGPAVNLGIIHMRNGRDQEATEILERAVEVCSDCAAAFNQLGISHRRQGHFDEAEAAYLHAIDADSNYPLAYFNLGVLYDLYLQRPQPAVDYYQQYLQIESDESSRAQVTRWIADLQRRLAAEQRTARAEHRP